jgi:hypothetical protein
MERASSQRHRGQGTRAFLQGADEAFHDGNAAPLADGAETLMDGVAATPSFEAVTTELLAPVGNQMPGRLQLAVAGSDETFRLYDVLQRQWIRIER